MADALRGASVRDEEVIIERPDGSRLRVRVNIGPLRDPNGQIVGTDLTQVEAAARLAAIVTTANDAIISKTLDGVITSWNRAAVRMFGWTEAEAVWTSLSSLIPLPVRCWATGVVFSRWSPTCSQTRSSSQERAGAWRCDSRATAPVPG
jgi:PAS domain-containing protein